MHNECTIGFLICTQTMQSSPSIVMSNVELPFVTGELNLCKLYPLNRTNML